MNKLSAADRSRINLAVAEAETKTSTEIIPVIAVASGRYDRAEDLWGLCLGAVFLAMGELIILPLWETQGHWIEWSAIPLAIQLLMLLAGFVLGILLSNSVSFLRRFFVLRSERNAEVLASAEATFFDQRVHHTSNRSGILIYLSLFEQQAVILADETALNAVGLAKIDGWCHDLTANLKSKSVLDALELSIQQIGRELEAILPASSKSKNKLPDALITLGMS